MESDDIKNSRSTDFFGKIIPSRTKILLKFRGVCGPPWLKHSWVKLGRLTFYAPNEMQINSNEELGLLTLGSAHERAICPNLALSWLKLNPSKQRVTLIFINRNVLSISTSDLYQVCNILKFLRLCSIIQALRAWSHFSGRSKTPAILLLCIVLPLRKKIRNQRASIRNLQILIRKLASSIALLGGNGPRYSYNLYAW